MATLLMRPADGGGADKKRRARKGKNAQKKQPQRGLGVAQLEKLRLQEQSLLCPSTSPSYSLRFSAADSDHPMVRCDADVSQTVLSLTPSNAHPQVVMAGGDGSTSTVVRGGDAGTLSRLSALNGHSTTQSCMMAPQHLAHDISKGNGEAFHAAAKRALASRALACLSQQSSKLSSINASFFSNVLTATQLQILETQAQAQQKVEERRAAAAAVAAAAGEPSGNAAAAASYIFPTINNYLKEASGNHAGDAGFKLHPVFADHFGSPTNIVRTNSAKELSSFQSYPSQQARPTAEKVLGRKRPWLALQENPRHACYAQALDLNAPVDESDAGYNDHSPVRQNQAPEFRVGAHYTTGIVRNALGNSSQPPGGKVMGCCSASHWQDNDSPSHVTAYFPEIGLYSDSAIGFRHCPSQSSIRDSCSSVTGSSSYLSRNHGHKPLKVPVVRSSLVEKESISSNFLTLGISSSSYPDRTNGWNESEESIQDNTPTSMNDVSRFRPHESTTSGCEGDNHASQVRKSVVRSEEVGGFDLKGDPCRSLSLEFDHGCGTKRQTSTLLRDSHPLPSSSHYNETFPPPSLPPPSIDSNSLGHAEDSNIDFEPSARSTRIVEDILDLRLKLAL